MNSLVRKNIIGITPYVAGKPIEETKRELGLKQVIKLASNENPLGPSPMAVAAIKKSIINISRYPDSQSFYLKNKIADKFGLKSANVVLGNGSDELIDVIIKTFVEDDENIITANITFLEYKIIAAINSRKVITVPLKSFKYDLDAIKGKINKKTKLIFISNPNNPTGTYVNRAELTRFMRGLPDNVLVVLDEAYDNFIDVDDFPNSLSYINSKKAIVLRTFSKGPGLAGLRVGYSLADASLSLYMERVRQPFNVNLLAQAGASAALDDVKFLRQTRKVILEGKEYLYRNLKLIGLPFVSSVANFILIDVGRDCVEVFQAMLKQGVIIRDMKQYDLDNFIRVTIGTEKENKAFIKALKEIR